MRFTRDIWGRPPIKSEKEKDTGLTCLTVFIPPGYYPSIIIPFLVVVSSQWYFLVCYSHSLSQSRIVYTEGENTSLPPRKERVREQRGKEAV